MNYEESWFHETFLSVHSLNPKKAGGGPRRPKAPPTLNKTPYTYLKKNPH